MIIIKSSIILVARCLIRKCDNAEIIEIQGLACLEKGSKEKTRFSVWVFSALFFLSLYHL